MNAANLTLRHVRAGLVLAAALLVAGCSVAASPAGPIEGGAASPVAASPPATSPAGAPGAPAGAPSDVPVQAPPLATAAPTATPTSGPSAPAGRPSDVPTQTPPLVTVPPSTQPVVGEAPAEVVAAARAHLAGRVTAGAAAGAAVIRSEEVVWPDGSLGCPELSVSYVALETAGYWIVLRVDGRDYDYRVAGRGTPRLCERLLPTNPGG
jgi:hypothetical protein